MVSDMRRRQAIATAAAGLVGTVAGGAALAGPAAGAPSTAGTPMRLDRLRLVFLSHVNDPATTSGFPGDPEFTLTTAFTVPEDGFYLQYVKEGEHTGTHWGAPVHFHEDGLAADQLDPGDLFLPAVKIDTQWNPGNQQQQQDPRDVPPRIQLYAPEPIDKDKPADDPLLKKPIVDLFLYQDSALNLNCRMKGF